MFFKTVLCVVGVHQSDRDVRRAMDLCAEVQAHLSVLVVCLAAPPPVGAYAAVLSEPWLQERENDNSELKQRVEEISQLTATAGTSCDVNGYYSEVVWADEAIGQRARYGDLTLIGAELLDDGDLRAAAIGGALFESARPVLLMPDGKVPTLRPKTVLVAWDSRIESARAVHEALPLLAGAERVHVTLVDPQAGLDLSGPEPGADVATYLGRHGIKVAVDRLPGGGRAVADVLAQHAMDLDADMIVMGAYGHSRLRERLFGGVTRTMIEKANLPVFMAH